jgi:hypothetical protein
MTEGQVDEVDTPPSLARVRVQSLRLLRFEPGLGARVRRGVNFVNFRGRNSFGPTPAAGVGSRRL